MDLLCQNCGASQDMQNVHNQCNYCGSAIISNQEIQKRIDQLNSNGNLFRLAEVAFEGGDFEEAIVYYNKCLEIDTDFFEAWFKKGLAIINTSTVGNFKSSQAIASLKQSILFAPSKKYFQRRLKSVLIPIVINYYSISLNHYDEFKSLDYTYSELHQKLERNNDLLKFIIANTELELEEVKQIWSLLRNLMGSLAGATLGNLTKTTSAIERITNQIVELQDSIHEIWKNLEPSTLPKKDNCFIATAAMGSYNHPNVIELRQFRDNWILEKKWGENFVSWYYHYGSIAAKSIEKSITLKYICYLFIVKPLIFVSRFLNLLSHDVK